MAVGYHPRTLAIGDLNGRQKAAILLAVIGPEAAADITSSLSQTELEEISLEIARLEEIPIPLAEAVLAEWEQTGTAALTLASGGVNKAKEILEQAVGAQKAAVIFKRIEAQLREAVGFTKLKQADPQQVATLLRNEHPQTIALICAHLDPQRTASMMLELPAALGSEVLYRMAKMEKVLPEVLQIVERSFGSDAGLSVSQDLAESGGPAAVAAVLNHVGTSLEKELMDAVAQQDAELCEQIKNLMFVFEDMVRLDDRSLQRVMRDVDMKQLAVALKAASDELKQKIFACMSQRALGALQEEMEFLGPVKVRDVDAAQAGVVKLVRALEESGDITISSGGDDVLI